MKSTHKLIGYIGAYFLLVGGVSAQQVQPFPSPPPLEERGAVLEPGSIVYDEDNSVTFSTAASELIAALRQEKTAGGVWNKVFTVLSALPDEKAIALWSECSEEIDGQILSREPEEMSAVLSEYISSGDDIDFKIPLDFRSNGRIELPGSLRLAALDALGVINPQQAASVSLPIIHHSEDLREVDIALRNIAWARVPGHEKILNDIALAVLRDPSIQANPSSAALHLFDVIVYTRDISSIDFLATLQRKSASKALSTAAHLALYKMNDREPRAVLKALRSSPKYLSDYPLSRADLFAMADISNPELRKLVEDYLLDKSLSKEELYQFVNIFPNRNVFVSQSLLTEYDAELALPRAVRGYGPATGEERKAQNGLYLELVSSWIADPRFSFRKDNLGELYARLKAM